MSIRVLVVDDSLLARKVIKDELSKDSQIEVVGVAGDPFDASEKIEALNPDVMTLDLEMPKMDGLTFLRSLMKHHPMPVVVVSAYTTKGSRLALEALEAGAVDIVPKPGMSYNVQEMSAELVGKVKAGAQAKVGRESKAEERKPTMFKRAISDIGVEGEANRPRPAPARPAAPTVEVLPPLTRDPDPEKVIVIGSSTGGTQALQYILMRLPANMPPILIVQHMPPGFTKAFADRLNGVCPMEVKEAENNDAVERGRVLIAPGGFHMSLRKIGGRYKVELNDGPRVQRQR
ncbi:MAG: chemotaxis-specific protein-glutamate methyltransferase CheB, partial [Deltaproteobacteria bacterium]|nr:chemotaxis-specific protein-glutamate methyltransferase CheB [Deltaproteobacteria bacterium]